MATSGPSHVVDAVLPADTCVGDFRIRALIGEGAMGEVYLAQDTLLGRRVALKVIKRSAMVAGGLTRFLEEARTTAQFGHPHIVTLHAVGEHEGRPFLALEYLDGESLRARIARGALPVREALRIMRAVADAIADAHRRGLVHADLKPENIIIPHDGRVRVVDFGLARIIGAAGSATSGTPSYMAPERWRDATVPSGAIDVWALGTILHELVSARRPFPDRELTTAMYGKKPLVYTPIADQPWSAIVADCLAWSPEQRPSADDALRRIAELLEPAVVAEATRSPFPGLAAFQRSDATHYFGRGTEIDAAVERLRAHPLLPIAGPSGAGKSSFVYAALIPRLEDRGPWKVIATRPGTSPFASLAAALTGKRDAQLAEALRAHPERLSLSLAAAGERVLLFVDQFEEAFTLAPDDAIAYCDCLALAATGDDAARIVITVRDDFLGKLAGSVHLRRHLGAVMALGPMSAADLRTAIAGPLARTGFAPDDPQLLGRIVDDVAGQPACLPLLQFTCHALWERRDPERRVVLVKEYEAIGRASGALAAYATKVLAQLSRDDIALVRAVLLALVDADGTRRPRLRTQLVELAGPGSDAIVDILLEHRLVVASRELEQDEARIELSHEALATAWPQLARWLDETHEQRLLVTEIEQATALWSRRGRRDDETWTGAALAEALRRVAEWNIALPADARSFLDAGARRADRQRRRRRWIVGGVVCVLAAAAIVAAVTAVAFSRKEREAIAQQAEIRLAAADLGRFDLELAPFDWDAAGQHRVTPAQLPVLQWQLLGVDPASPRDPGTPYAAGDIVRGVPITRDGVIAEIVEARSGPAFLEVFERGGNCPSSRLYLQRIPGYRERVASPRKIHIAIPTCQASRAPLVEIAAGSFYRNVSRDDDTPPFDEHAVLPRYAIDRTEVTRGAFAIYGELAPLTGDSAAPSDFIDARSGSADSLPIAGVNYFTARSYCRYMGKDLPTIDQWQKAFRGGETLPSGPNPAPQRKTVWRTATSPRPANLRPANGNGVPAPVGTYPDDTSPYGVRDLAGNVGEWTASPANERHLRMVLGGGWNIPASEHADEIAFRNARADLSISYEIGIRCVEN